jgi:hypothetical protein
VQLPSGAFVHRRVDASVEIAFRQWGVYPRQEHRPGLASRPANPGAAPALEPPDDHDFLISSPTASFLHGCNGLLVSWLTDLALGLAAHVEHYRVDYGTVRPHQNLSWNRPIDVHLGRVDSAIPDFSQPQTLPSTRSVTRCNRPARGAVWYRMAAGQWTCEMVWLSGRFADLPCDVA